MPAVGCTARGCGQAARSLSGPRAPTPLPRSPQNVPLDMAEFELRAREVEALRRWVAAPAAALRRDQRPVLTPDYMAAVVPK